MTVRRKRLLIAAAVLLGVPAVAVGLAISLLTPRTQGAMVTWLVAQFGGGATVGSVQWSLRPGSIFIAADEIRVTHPSAETPVVEVERVSLETTLADLLSTPRRIRLVRASGLIVRVARRNPGESGRDEERSGDGGNDGSPGAPQIDRVIAEAARIEIVSSRPEKPPLVFDVHDLTIDELAPGKPMRFAARLTNPKPAGEVSTAGTLGPWNRRDAGRTPIAGTYGFAHADLASFRGLAGVLDAQGTYSGSLGEIHATGGADIREFTLTGRPVAMKTRYDVLVGGTTGDVVLQPVEVSVGGSQLVSSGSIVRAREVKGRRIEMDVKAEQARIEDLLQLALPGEAPLSGPVDLSTVLRIEPSDLPMLQRLQLDGRFAIRQARFARTDIQSTLARLSRMTGGGAVEGASGSGVASNLNGRFALASGVLHLSDVTFDVPGTAVRLSGRYGLERGSLDLAGTIRIARSVADVAPERVVGWMDAIGRIDRRLRLDTTGTTIPITITGSRDKPIFRVNAGGLKRNWREAVGVGR